MARDGMGGGYRNFVDGVMNEVKNSSAPTLTDLWKITVKEELG
jgi:hypothetical protein